MTQPLEVTLARLEGKVDVLNERVSGQGVSSAETARALQRGLDEVKAAVQQAREEARHDASEVRVDLERQVGEVAADLAAHIELKNPHPHQEEWLRRDTRTVAAEVGRVRDEIATAKGAWRVISVVGACAIGVASAVISALITHALGG